MFPTRSTPTRRRFILTTAMLLVALTCATAMAAGWEEVSDDDGVVVSMKAVEGRDLPIFRGVAVIDSSMIDIMAVLNDTEKATEWMANCAESKILKRLGDFERIVYNRTDSPWPVSDRDVVIQSKTDINVEKRTIHVKFWSIKSPLKGEVEDVVRMPRLKGHYKFKALSRTRTRVEYQVDADPGGSLPDWLAESATEDLPRKTLLGLAERAKKTSKDGTYKEFVAKWTERLALDKLEK